MRVQPWWDELRSLTVDWYETRAEAEAAEEAAIKSEWPKYNKTHLVPRKGRRPAAAPEPQPVPAPAIDDEFQSLLNAGRLYSPEEAEARLGLEAGTLVRAALGGGGPCFYDLREYRRYALADVRDWLASRQGRGESVRLVSGRWRDG